MGTDYPDFIGGNGIIFYNTFGVLQITKLPRAIRYIFEKEKGVEGDDGDVSAFASLCTTLAATIGTGSIVGVATALRTGGPGALFGCGCLPLWE